MSMIKSEMKSVVITGVSTGIGHSLAHVFAKNGYLVFGSVRKPEDARRMEELLGDRFFPLVFDVTDEVAVNRAAGLVSKVLGTDHLTGLINNAGISLSGPVLYLPLEDFRHQFEVNLFGMIAVTKAFVPLLKADETTGHRAGRIINMGSVSGKIGFPFMAPYCSSKFAVEGFSESLRRELLLYGIDVIVVAPGPVATSIWDKVPHPTSEVKNSDFGPFARRVYNYMVKLKDAGILNPDRLAEKIFHIMENKRPKTRYTFVKNKFKEYILPKYLLSPRRFDGILKKRLMH